MHNDIDIVDRLRIAWTSMTDMGNAEREEAANQIELMRSQITDLNIEIEMLRKKCAEKNQT